MPCRDTAISGVAQYLARNSAAIDDVQMLSMYGELKRSPEARAATAPTDAEWLTHLRRMDEALEGDQSLTEGRRTRSRSVITEARRAPADGPTFYAMSQVQARASAARFSMDNIMGQIATQHGVTREHVVADFKALVAENRSIRRTDSPPTAPAHLGYDPSGIPADRATRWALAVLRSGGTLPQTEFARTRHRTIVDQMMAAASERCGNCGEFVGTGAHMCPETAAAPVVRNTEASTTDAESVIDTPVSFRRMDTTPTGQPTDYVSGPVPRPLEEREQELLETRTPAPARSRLPRRPAPGLVTPVPVPEPVEPSVPVVHRTSERRYRLDSGYAIRVQNRSNLMRQLRDNGGNQVTFPISVSTPDRRTVSGEIQILDRNLPGHRWSSSREGDRYAMRNGDRSLRCTCVDYRRTYDCEHVRETREQMTAWLNEREPRAAVAPDESVAATGNVLLDGFTAADAAGQTARTNFQATDDGVSYENDMEKFQEDWDEARTRYVAGDRSIPFMRENVTGGLSTRENGRSFGLEIEIDFPNDQPVYDGEEGRLGHYRSRRALAQALHDEGLSEWDYPLPWHGLRTRGGYSDAPNRWSVQFDRSVDGLDGLRGAELVSPILYDEPQTWDNLNRICELVREHGGEVTVRTGLHVNIGGGDFNHTIENHNNLLKMADTYEDQLIRCANNPENGGEWHRGRTFCAPVTLPANGFRSISQARLNNGHMSMVNLVAMPDEHNPVVASTRAEFRQFDGTLDVGRIQANTKISLAMMDAAKRGVDLSQAEREPAGAHRERNHNGRRMPRLTGEAWAEDTKGFRKLVDTLFSRAVDKKQMVALFASSKWQKAA